MKYFLYNLGDMFVCKNLIGSYWGSKFGCDSKTNEWMEIIKYVVETIDKQMLDEYETTKERVTVMVNDIFSQKLSVPMQVEQQQNGFLNDDNVVMT